MNGARFGSLMLGGFVWVLAACGGDDKGGGDASTPADTGPSIVLDAGADARLPDGPASALLNVARVAVAPVPPASLKLTGAAGAALLSPGTLAISVGDAAPVTTTVALTGAFTITVPATPRDTLRIEITAGAETKSEDFTLKNGQLLLKP